MTVEEVKFEFTKQAIAASQSVPLRYISAIGGMDISTFVDNETNALVETIYGYVFERTVGSVPVQIRVKAPKFTDWLFKRERVVSRNVSVVEVLKDCPAPSPGSQYVISMLNVPTLNEQAGMGAQ